MKRALAIGLSGAVLAASLTLAGADSPAVEAEPAAAVLPSGEIVRELRQMGLNPIGEPVRRGPYYVMHAYDPRGIEMRVIADAQFGDILSVLPARALNAVFAPQYERAPRIIQVPPRSEGESHDSPVEPAAPKPNKQSNAPPPVQRRAVLNAPPPPVDPDLTPIYPTPRFNAPAESSESTAPPKETP